MAKGTPRSGRSFEEIGQVIVAAWFKALSDDPNVPPTPIDKDEMTAAFKNILVEDCEAVIDTATKMYISVPYPPEKTRMLLANKIHLYTQNYNLPPGDPNYPKDQPCNPLHHANKSFAEDMGYSIMFGCGR